MFYDRKKLFDGIRKTLATGGLNQGQVNGIEILLEEGESRNFNTEWIAYVLATAWHETGATMQPVRETFASSDKQAISRLTSAWKKGKLKVSQDYWSGGYFGRGYVQLTHEYNYKKMGDWLGLDLVNKPSLALDPKVAAKIIYEGMLKGMFTGKKLPDYLDGIDEPEAEDLREYTAARYIVNGKDRAKQVGQYAVRFEDALRTSEGAAPVVVPKPAKPSKPEPTVEAPIPEETESVEIMPTAPQNEPKPVSMSTTIWSVLGSVGTAIVGILANLHPIVQGILVVAVIGFGIWIIRERLKKGGLGGLFG